ncbi:MAG: hypothetical protein KAS12_02820 [Candidatus Aenigmarchaeota archaeon]|nr:hypothetical protein [Candidatus Aenigmarchaeota archaeon]
MHIHNRYEALKVKSEYVVESIEEFWYKKSKNDEISLEILKTTSDAQWNWFIMSKNSYLTNEIIIEYIDKEWDWNYIISEFPINIAMLKSKSDWTDLHWKLLSNNPHLMIKMVNVFKDKNWDWALLSEKMQWVNIINHLHLPWIWDYISRNKSINVNALALIPDAKWDEHILTENTAIPIEFIIEKGWANKYNFSFSLRQDLTIKFIREHPEIRWDWWCLSGNAVFSFNDIMENLDFLWNKNSLEGNKKLTRIERISIYDTLSRRETCIIMRLLSRFWNFISSL